MTSVFGISSVSPYYIPTSSSEVVSVATALKTLRVNPNAQVTIADSLANIKNNIAILQKNYTKIKSLNTTDANPVLNLDYRTYKVSTQLLSVWANSDAGAVKPNQVDITNASAIEANYLFTLGPSYIKSISVSDTALKIQSSLTSLKLMTTNGILKEISQIGGVSPISVTKEQYDSSQSVFAKFKNGAYSLALTGVTVDQTIGASGLSTDSKVRSISITDTTEAIATNIDKLKQIGLRIKSISQTNSSAKIAITADQVKSAQSVLTKILTPYQLAVLEARTNQLVDLNANSKVFSINIVDNSVNISKNWGVLNQISDHLSSVVVTDQTTPGPITITADQLAVSSRLVSKFDATGFSLALTDVSASEAASLSDLDEVVSIKIADSGDNIASTITASNELLNNSKVDSITISDRKSITLTAEDFKNKIQANSSFSNKINNGNYRVSLTNVKLEDVATLSANRMVGDLTVSDSGENIATNLSTLIDSGVKIKSIDQEDGTPLNLSYDQFINNNYTLNKIIGGYTVVLSDVPAEKTSLLASNMNVVSFAVKDNAANIGFFWNELQGSSVKLTGIENSDAGVITVDSQKYFSATREPFISTFLDTSNFIVKDASLVEAAKLATYTNVSKFSVKDSTYNISNGLDKLLSYKTGNFLTSITNINPKNPISVDYSDISKYQPIFNLIDNKDYVLKVNNVNVTDVVGLCNSNSKVAWTNVTGSGSDIVSNLSSINNVGKKILGITQTDLDTNNLEISLTNFEKYQFILSKIVGGYYADISDVTAPKALALATNNNVNSLKVKDTSTGLLNSWQMLKSIGNKLSDIKQIGSTILSVTSDQFKNSQNLLSKFTSDLSLTVTNALISDISSLTTTNTHLTLSKIEIKDNSANVGASFDSIAANSKVTKVIVKDPTNPFTLTANQYTTNKAGFLKKVQDDNYAISITGLDSTVTKQLISDNRVKSIAVLDSGADISTDFAALSGITKVGSIQLREDDQDINLVSSVFLSHANLLEKFSSSYSLNLTKVKAADISLVTSFDNLNSLAIEDTSSQIGTTFSQIRNLGNSLTGITITDPTALINISYSDWVGAGDLFSKISPSYSLKLDEVSAADASFISTADSHVAEFKVSDTSENISAFWDDLVTQYNAGSGKLKDIVSSDSRPLSLTDTQISTGEAVLTTFFQDFAVTTIE